MLGIQARGHAVECRHDAQAELVQVQPHRLRPARALVHVGLGSVLARQKARRQRIKVDHAYALLLAQRLQLAFKHCSVVQVVQRLQTFVARKAMPGAALQRLGQSRGAVVRCANRAHLARLDQIAKRAQHILERNARVVIVRLVQIDVIRLQALERRIHRLLDVFRVQAHLAIAHVLAHLGGQHQLAAPCGRLPQPFADDGLGLATHMPRCPTRIHIRRVHKVHARIQPRIKQRKARRLIHRPAKHIAAKTQR
ncbi:hypothetical protein SDC9_142921 [bioreactor metagenome]|uniref:Uncharacterized protein n=1 Tax=bioreactor metagenome TaxID=1076179 RepID=A0A645E2I0_9ZZZZ